MTRDPYEWELAENRKYFVHARNNGNNYYDPTSWDISQDTRKHLIDTFNQMMEDAKKWRKMGLDV